jgi:transposase
VPRGTSTPEAERIRELEARIRALEASERKLATERDILRKAAKYFAGETNW